MDKETTFKETYKLLEEHGWEKITAEQYTLEKKLRKHQTARIELNGFFKLKKSNQEIAERKKG